MTSSAPTKPESNRTRRFGSAQPSAVRVYARSTRLSFEGFGRRRRGAVSPEPCGLARPDTSSGDTWSFLVMKGSPVRVRASASHSNRQVPAQETFLLPAHTTGAVIGGRSWTQRRVQRGFIGTDCGDERRPISPGPALDDKRASETRVRSPQVPRNPGTETGTSIRMPARVQCGGRPC
jgi:hypothetical protein